MRRVLRVVAEISDGTDAHIRPLFSNNRLCRAVSYYGRKLAGKHMCWKMSKIQVARPGSRFSTSLVFDTCLCRQPSIERITCSCPFCVVMHSWTFNMKGLGQNAFEGLCGNCCQKGFV